MGTVTGSVYSNYDFEKSGQDNSPSTNINSKINGGGIPVNLKTVSGDIFFRVE